MSRKLKISLDQKGTTAQETIVSLDKIPNLNGRLSLIVGKHSKNLEYLSGQVPHDMGGQPLQYPVVSLGYKSDILTPLDSEQGKFDLVVGVDLSESLYSAATHWTSEGLWVGHNKTLDAYLTEDDLQTIENPLTRLGGSPLELTLQLYNGQKQTQQVSEINSPEEISHLVGHVMRVHFPEGWDENGRLRGRVKVVTENRKYSIPQKKMTYSECEAIEQMGNSSLQSEIPGNVGITRQALRNLRKYIRVNYP